MRIYAIVGFVQIILAVLCLLDIVKFSQNFIGVFAFLASGEINLILAGILKLPKN